MATRSCSPRRATLAAIGLALLFGACAGAPTPALVGEVGDSFGRLRTGVARTLEPTAGPVHTLSPQKLFARLRQGITRLPTAFRMHASILPDATDVGRLLAPPSPAWQPSGLSQRFVSRYRF